MPTDAPDGLINAHVVQGRRPDHVDPKPARTKTHEPAETAPADKAKDEDKPADKDTAKPVKAADKKGADKG